MIQFLKNSKHQFLIAFIILGAAFRFYTLGSWSFSNDELSALMRTNFDNLFELLKSYSSEVDTHPPLVQLFLFCWIKLFGTSELAIRFPFALMGISCIPLAYKIFKDWVSEIPALFISASIALLSYLIVYSQIARPYIFGMFFFLLFIYYWKSIVVDSKYNLKNYVLYVIVGICNIYIHYFLNLSFLICILTGLFIIRKFRYKTYFILNGIIAISFLPYLKYFFIQLNMGGIGGWLPPPTNMFYIDYLNYSLNFSPLIEIVFSIILIVGIIHFYRNKYLNKKQLIFLLWFITPFIVGFLYSKYKNPVIQYSTLIFCFPFFLAFIFSFLEYVNWNKRTRILLILYSSILILTSSISWKSYHSIQFADFKNAAKTTSEWSKKLKNENYILIANCIDKSYLNYYFKKFQYSKNPLNSNYIDENELALVNKSMVNSTSDYLLYTWVNVNNPFEIKDLIRLYYPEIVKSKKYANAEVILYKRNHHLNKEFSFLNNFEEKKENDLWEFSASQIDSSFNNKYYKVDTLQEFPLSLKNKYLKNLQLNGSDLISFKIQFKAKQQLNAVLVLTIGNNDSVKEWRGTNLSHYTPTDSIWTNALVSIYLNKKTDSTDRIKAYVWNRNKQEFFIDNAELYTSENNQYYLK